MSEYIFSSGMRRRQYLTTAVGAIAVTAGCTSSTTTQAITADVRDPDPNLTEAGLAPDPIDLPEREVDESQFTDYNSEGTEIQQVPLDVAYYWYHTRKARFVDARTAERYDQVHVKGAISSPAPDGTADDPMNDIGDHERIVTYCMCPHYLSGLRAASRQNSGNAGAYALYTGIRPWVDEGYPIGGVKAEEPELPDEEDYSNADN
jgi:rhodanese-related sulfurtransferase